MSDVEWLRDRLSRARCAMAFTGAGISTLSGIPDFRSPGGAFSHPRHGLAVEQILSLDCFEVHPEYFYEWAKTFVYGLGNFQPNTVHRTLAKLEKLDILRQTYTQNIDILHQRAGTTQLGELHGSPATHHCRNCGDVTAYDEIAPLVQQDILPRCRRCGGVIKPDIVFYGETLNETLLQQAFRDMKRCDLLLVLGSSLTVQPAAGLPVAAMQNGAEIVIVNAAPTALDRYAARHFSDLTAPFEFLEPWADALLSAKGSRNAEASQPASRD